VKKRDHERKVDKHSAGKCPGSVALPIMKQLMGDIKKPSTCDRAETRSNLRSKVTWSSKNIPLAKYYSE
jgi:hypothetical protein